MLHGMVTGSHASWWMTCAPRLARAHRVVLYDLRGHGHSDRPRSGYELDDHLGDFDRVRHDTVGDEPVALVGHSFGARLSLELARRQPDTITGVVAVDPPLIRPDGADTPWSTDDPAWTAVPRERRATHRRTRRVPLSETTLRDDTKKIPLLTMADLAEVRCPVSFVFGDESPFVNSAEMASAVFGPDHVTLLPGGHAVHVDSAKALGEHVERFLAQLDPIGGSAAAPQGVSLDTVRPAAATAAPTVDPDHA